MYNGTIEILQQWRRDKYIHGLGTFSVPGGVEMVTRYLYTCDHCGGETRSPIKADEPFYCHSAACQGGKLISIT